MKEKVEYDNGTANDTIIDKRLKIHVVIPTTEGRNQKPQKLSLYFFGLFIESGIVSMHVCSFNWYEPTFNTSMIAQVPAS